MRVEIERCELQLTTPLTSMSLRFDDDKECFKWAKAIETVRAALKVKATSPNRRRVSPIVQQISRRGLEAKLRANRADVGDDMGKLIAAGTFLAPTIRADVCKHVRASLQNQAALNRAYGDALGCAAPLVPSTC